MKILIILGSGRKHGNTDQACEIFRKALHQCAAQAGAVLETETVYLGELTIAPCRGCRTCFDHGEDRCPLKNDDLASLREKMRIADGLLITSPVYVDDVSGLVKNWIDRIAHACHRPEFGGKYAYLLVTTGSSPTGHALRTLTIALSTWGYQIVGKVGLTAGARMKADEMRQKHSAPLQKAAERLFKAISQKQFFHPTFFSLMMFRIQQLGWKKANPETIDYHYWQDKGWFTPSFTYYIPHQGSPVITALARLVGTLVARLIR
jgi:multimeric flavodoxin WrbA